VTRVEGSLLVSAASPPARWRVLTLTDVSGWLVQVRDEAGRDWLTWWGPSAPESAVSHLRYVDPFTDAVTAVPVAVFVTEADARTAYGTYQAASPRRRPAEMRVVPLGGELGGAPRKP
jgi:hypothetical protein